MPQLKSVRRFVMRRRLRTRSAHEMKLGLQCDILTTDPSVKSTEKVMDQAVVLVLRQTVRIHRAKFPNDGT